MNINFGIVEQKRKELSLSQKELCSRIGFDEGSYSKFKSGKRRPSLNFVEKLYFELGLTISQIFIQKKEIKKISIKKVIGNV